MANPNGTPIWFELTTPDADQAKQFYAAVAGWQVAPAPIPDSGGYLIAGPDADHGVAGLMTAREGMPTGWWIYFAADDVDAMAKRVEELGGQVHIGPMDIPEVGRFASVSDPQGVMLNIMTPANEQPSVAYKPGAIDNVGHAVWIELATPSPNGAFEFYGQLFGWTKAGGMPMGEMGEYAFIGADGPPCPAGQNVTGPGAIMPSETTGASPRWNWYIHVPDIDVAVATGARLGGRVFQDPTEIPGGSYSANLVDAQGFSIGLVGPRH